MAKGSGSAGRGGGASGQFITAEQKYAALPKRQQKMVDDFLDMQNLYSHMAELSNRGRFDSDPYWIDLPSRSIQVTNREKRLGIFEKEQAKFERKQQEVRDLQQRISDAMAPIVTRANAIVARQQKLPEAQRNNIREIISDLRYRRPRKYAERDFGRKKPYTNEVTAFSLTAARKYVDELLSSPEYRAAAGR